MRFDKSIYPDNANKILNTTGLVRIPFNTVNSSINDMLSIYANGLLSSDTYESMKNACSRVSIDIHISYFYIFTSRQYNSFLKLISKENSITRECFTCTTENKVLYSTQENCSYDQCPTFSLADAEAYENIETTPYRKFFSENQVHLCKLTTRRQVLGKRPIKLTEICLFIPE